ncbi:anti-sigma factor [Ramlibacter henchirensis]|uniref:Anti-sigma factor n=1 Tax=Ramlibacter henchirensis TaxID=204072 RepID=A0A4Z0C3B3_9BURK|nr:anti-sigma factor [Ramlibacter henchirensis]TFZ06023.1 anti-sigma factor [Ramlibacter henchirensis]
MSSSAATALPSSHALAPGVYAYDMEALPWRETPRGTAREKAVRRDDEAGLFLGLLAFDPLSRSGVHQHLATATSYFLAGSLTDFQGTTGEGAVGINLAGAAHDAVSYPGALLVSRLEGPVIIPDGGLAIHPHAKADALRRANPETPPDLCVVLDQTLSVPTRFGGVARKALFDYAGTGDDRRLCNLNLWPQCPPLRVKHTAITDFFILAGDLLVDDKPVSGPAFVLIEPGAEVTLASRFGCSLLAWAEGPAHCVESGAELYGFARR